MVKVDETAVVKVGEMAMVKISVHKDTTPRANKGPANMWTTESEPTTRPNGKTPGSTAKPMATKAVATKSATTEPAAAKSMASFSERNRACHRHHSGGSNRENVLHLFHRATQFFVLSMSQ